MQLNCVSVKPVVSATPRYRRKPSESSHFVPHARRTKAPLLLNERETKLRYGERSRPQFYRGIHFTSQDAIWFNYSNLKQDYSMFLKQDRRTWVWDDRYGWCLCLFISPQRQADPNYIITHKLVYLSGRCSCIAWISGTVYLILLFNWVLSFPCLCFLWSNSIKTYIFLLYKTIFNFSF